MTEKQVMDLGGEADELGWSINTKFAKKYEEKKKTEELSKLRDKYGDINVDEESEESSSDEEEDEHGELCTPAIDAQVLKTVAAIRSKNPSIYDNDKSFFSGKEMETAKDNWNKRVKQKKGSKPMFLKDYERKTLLGEIKEEENMPLTHVEEQKRLKEDFKAAFEAGDDDDDEGGVDGLFSVRKNVEIDDGKDDIDYKKYIMETIENDENCKKSMPEWLVGDTGENEKPSKRDDGEAFLANFFMKRGWVDKSNDNLPMYDEIIDEEDDVEEAEAFEYKYNFRFEEEGGAQIASHARDVTDSLRRSDNKRKKKRDAAKERRQAEKQKIIEEKNRLKNLKRREIMEKAEKIRAAAGSKTLAFDDTELEKDFDPQEFDRQMDAAFDDSYYEESDKKKPIFEDDIDISDLVGDGGENEEEVKDVEKSVDDYYNLHFEDIISGGMTTRFKYKDVDAFSYGMSFKDILKSDDRDLNSHVSLKKLAPYLPEARQKHDMKKYKKRKYVYMPHQKRVERDRANQDDATNEAEAGPSQPIHTGKMAIPVERISTYDTSLPQRKKSKK